MGRWSSTCSHLNESKTQVLPVALRSLCEMTPLLILPLPASTWPLSCTRTVLFLRNLRHEVMALAFELPQEGRVRVLSCHFSNFQSPSQWGLWAPSEQVSLTACRFSTDSPTSHLLPNSLIDLCVAYHLPHLQVEAPWGLGFLLVLSLLYPSG